LGARDSFWTLERVVAIKAAMSIGADQRVMAKILILPLTVLLVMSATCMPRGCCVVIMMHSHNISLFYIVYTQYTILFF
jgi:hypothetical protein